jgi:hypothetical protein
MRLLLVDHPDRQASQSTIETPNTRYLQVFAGRKVWLTSAATTLLQPGHRPWHIAARAGMVRS